MEDESLKSVIKKHTEEMLKKSPIERFRKIMMTMFKEYPAHVVFGFIESSYPFESEKVIEILVKDKIIELSRDSKLGRVYRLTEKGINFAVAMINLEYNKNVLKYSKIMKKLTIWVIVLSVFTLSIGLIQLFIKPPIFNILPYFNQIFP